jgi:hypothetical protein
MSIYDMSPLERELWERVEPYLETFIHLDLNDPDDVLKFTGFIEHIVDLIVEREEARTPKDDEVDAALSAFWLAIDEDPVIDPGDRPAMAKALEAARDKRWKNYGAE